MSTKFSFDKLHYFFGFNGCDDFANSIFITEHVDFIFQDELMFNNKASIRIAIGKKFIKLSIQLIDAKSPPSSVT